MDYSQMSNAQLQKLYKDGDAGATDFVLRGPQVEQPVEQLNEQIEPQVDGEVQVEERIDQQEDMDNSNVPEKSNGGEVNETVETPIDYEEIERQRKYAEFKAQQAEEERKRLLIEKTTTEQKFKEEAKRREVLEKRLRELEEMKQQSPVSPSVEDEEDEFASDYSKKTRQILKQEIEALKSQGTSNELLNRLEQIESKFQEQEKVKQQEIERIRREESDRRLYSEIERLQGSYENLKTSKPVQEVINDVQKFREDMAVVTKSQSLKDLEMAITDYYNGGKIKEIADKHGIRPVADYNKAQEIQDLVDFKNGVKFNPYTGEYDKILNDDGLPIAYRSLEEAYKVKNIDTLLNNTRKDSYKEVQKKLDTFNEAPVTLSDTEVTSHESGSPANLDQEIIGMSQQQIHQAMRDPQKAQLIRQTFEKYGLPLNVQVMR